MTYKRIIKNAGYRRAFSYFIQCHLFDLIHNVETRHMVSKDNLSQSTRNNSEDYMASWTYILKRIFKFLDNLNLNNFTFVDIGSGKGKALLSWYLYYDNLNICGIESDNQLIEICQTNFKKVAGQEIKILHANAANIQYNTISDNLIIFLYNPFNAVVLDSVLKALEGCNAIVIYNNPVHESLFDSNSWNKLHEYKSWHANTHFVIYTNNVSCETI